MKKKPQNAAGLHNFVKQGGKPKDYKGTKGLNSATVPNLKAKNK